MIILYFLVYLQLTKGEIFTAIADLTQSLEIKIQLENNLLKLADEERSNLYKLKLFSKSFNYFKNERPEKYVANPLQVYILIKHIINIWKTQFPLVTSRNKNVENILINILNGMHYLPTDDDFKGTIDAILRLQDTYKIKTQKLANGVFHHTISSRPLSSIECFDIGLRSFEKDYFHFVQWISQAYYQIDKSITKLEKMKIIDYLSYGFYKQGNLRQALSLSKELLKINAFDTRALENQEYFASMNIKSKDLNTFFKGDTGNIYSDPAVLNVRPIDYERGKEFQMYKALCRGESPIQNPDIKLLKCQFYIPHYYFVLAPIKEEIIFYNPRIVMYHNIINDNEIKEIKKLSIHKLNRATVQNSFTGKLEFANYRISKSTWLKSELSETIKKINLRISILTGINLETSEELQVANYGIGGHYEPHFDFARKIETNSFESEIGNRIATLIFYISNVEAGGATVFTDIGAKLWPKKGSAAFWWNLYPSGEGDLSTRHAACPVILGSKWVMNKWFHERGQEFIRPCALDIKTSNVIIKTTQPKMF